MRKIYLLIVLCAFSLPLPAQSKIGAIEFLYSCKSCGKRFKGYVPQDLASFAVEKGKDTGERDDEGYLNWEKILDIKRVSGFQRYDSDMCYIYGGVNKYNLLIVTCPYCGFSLSHKHFTDLTPSDSVKQKINETLKPRMDSLRQIMKTMANGMDIACDQVLKELKKEKNKHKELKKEEHIHIDPKKNMISGYDIQKLIPPYIKYRNAIECYKWLNFSPSYISRVALNGSWAYRVQICMLFTTNDRGFKQAYRSVENMLEKRAKKLKSTEGKNTTVLFRELLVGISSEKKLSDMEKFIIYNMLVGLNDRLGRSREASQYLSRVDMLNFGKEPEPFERYIKKKKRWLSFERYFQNVAIEEKKKGFSLNLSSRSEIFTEMYILSELYKRTGRLNTAAMWCRTMLELKDLESAALKHGAGKQLKEISNIMKTGGADDVLGPDDAEILKNIKDGLGTVSWYSRNGVSKKGLSPSVCNYVLTKIGYALVVFKDKRGFYPDSFEELWEKMTIRGRSEVNYFCCPVSGKPYLYHPAKTGYKSWPLVCDPEPHLFKDKGKRYGVFRTDGRITAEKTIPAEIK
ncbi:DUF2225 domain-containing protein [Planctomycetota bacterium]